MRCRDEVQGVKHPSAEWCKTSETMIVQHLSVIDLRFKCYRSQMIGQGAGNESVYLLVLASSRIVQE